MGTCPSSAPWPPQHRSCHSRHGPALQGQHSKPQQEKIKAGERQKCLVSPSTALEFTELVTLGCQSLTPFCKHQSHPAKTLVEGLCCQQCSYLQTERGEQQTEVPPRQIKEEIWNNQRHLWFYSLKVILPFSGCPKIPTGLKATSLPTIYKEHIHAISKYGLEKGLK